ncbi:uncharacterized protein B0P05DRAFT_535056 [Gilbertella persicaria]|uniref:uncharacterized protein n=1 Tax=Gilbertella persicaria TaxID=101096 RepID=UPI00222027AE|nr:uncharacterized protein B0P05DRAFT_535056 [Gilbertella persicaria]KAI8084312.1 hypothetical protein B0P05DRAFT_535056 [Gilbertella persicaria]
MARNTRQKTLLVFPRDLMKPKVDIGYVNDPTEPFLIWKIKSNQKPLRYRAYANEAPAFITSNEVSTDRTLLGKRKNEENAVMLKFFFKQPPYKLLSFST